MSHQTVRQLGEPMPRTRGQRGSAVVDFVLVSTILVPLFLGILQVGLFLYVRNTVTAAASEGAHYAAVLNRAPADGASRTRELINGVVTDNLIDSVSGDATDIDGQRQYVQVTKAHVFGVAAKDGKLLWKVDFPGVTVIPTPVVQAPYVYVTGGRVHSAAMGRASVRYRDGPSSHCSRSQAGRCQSLRRHSLVKQPILGRPRACRDSS